MKTTLTNLVNLQNETSAVTAINNNNAIIETAFDNTLSRDGTSPNQMAATIDMNSNRIINLPTAISTTEPVTLSQMTAALVANGNINTGLTGVPVSAAMQPVVNASTTAAAYTLLGGVPVSVAMQPVVNAATTSAAYTLLTAGVSQLQFSTAVLIATSTIASNITGFYTLGYHTVGDGGAGIYKRTTVATTGGLVSQDGAFWQLFPILGVYTPEMFGAYGNGVTDDTTALQNCISSVPTGGILSNGNPTANYLVSSTIFVNKPITILTTIGCALIPTSALGSSPVMHFVGSSSGLTYPTILENLFIGNPGTATRYGGLGIEFDTTVAGNYFRGLELRNVFVQAGVTGNYGIAFLNNTINNPNGGIYLTTIKNGDIQGGVWFSGVGDSIVMDGTVVPYNSSPGADNKGILVDLISGAGSFVLNNINFSQPGGCIFDNAYSCVIQGCEFEAQVAITEPNNSIVDFRASSGTIQGVKFRNNQVQAIAGIGTPLLLRVSSNVGHIVVDGNAFATPTSYTGVTNASASLQLGPNYWLTGAPHISGTAAANTYGGG